MNKSDFTQMIEQAFDKDELEELMFDMDINHENVKGSTLHVQVRELVKHVQRRKNEKELLKKLREARPDWDWPEAIPQSSLSSTSPSINFGMLTAVIGAVVVIGIIAVYMLFDGGLGSSFMYQVQVAEEISGASISNANVTILGQGRGPMSGRTDAAGVYIVEIPADLASTAGQLLVEHAEYEPYALNVTFREGDLPQQILLTPKQE